jgi:hypothetical protein
LTSAIVGGKWPVSHPGHFIPGEIALGKIKYNKYEIVISTRTSSEGKTPHCIRNETVSSLLHVFPKKYTISLSFCA